MGERMTPKPTAWAEAKRNAWVICLAAVVSGLAFGEEESPPPREFPLSIHAFGTLGAARSTSGTAQYVRDSSQPYGLKTDWSPNIDSVFGAQANYNFTASTEAVVQVISRYRYNGNWGPEVSWAYIGHEFTPGLKLRAGRLGTEFYMLSDSRLIGYSNLTVRPAPDFFSPLIFSYFDGADISGSLPVGSGLLRAKLFQGYSPEKTPFFGDIAWDLSGSRLRGGYLDYLDGPWQFRLSHAEVRFSSHEIPVNQLAAPYLSPYLAFLPSPNITTLVPELSTVGKTAGFSSLGVVYDKGPFRLQGMYGRIQHESRSYENSWSAFLLASYRIGEVTPYLGYSTVKSSQKALSNQPSALLATVVDNLRKPAHMDRHTVTLGARWDFRENMALKAQLDLVRGDPESYMPYRGEFSNWSGKMEILSVALDFAF